jgi:DNA-binding Xre family transcriptional regulator
VIGLYVAKNGVVIASSEMYSTTSSGGRAESITCQTILELNEGDYVEMYVENTTAATNITVEYLNVICKSLN